MRIAEKHPVGELLRIEPAVLLLHDLLLRRGEGTGVFRAQLLERLQRVDPRGQNAQKVPGRRRGVVDGFGMPDLDLQSFQLLLGVVELLHPRAGKFQLTRKEPFADEDLPGLLRVAPRVIDPAVRVEDQPVAEHLFPGADEAAEWVVGGLIVVADAEVRRGLLHHFRLDLGVDPGEDLRSLHHGEGHDPLRCGLFPRERGAGEEEEFPSARAPVNAVFPVVGPHVPGNSGQYRRVELFRMGQGELFQRPLELHGFPQIRGQIAPLLDAQEVEIAALAHLPQQPVGVEGVMLPQIVPDVQDPHEVGTLVVQRTVEVHRRLFLVHGPLPGVADGKEGRRHQHFGQAGPLFRLDQHGPDVRIEGQFRETGPETGGLPGAGVQRLKVVEGAQAFPHRRRIGGIEEGETFDAGEPQSGHLQNHPREGDPADLRIGVRGGLFQIAFGIEVDAEPRPGPAAAPPALAGRSLRDHFELEFLDAAPGIVALHPGEACVDAAADVGDGEGGLGHVGAEDDPPEFPRMEDLLLIGAAQAAVKLEHLHPGVAPAVEHVRRVPDLPFPGQEDERVAPELLFQIELHAPRHQLRQLLVGFGGEEGVLDGEGPPLDVDDGGVVEESGKGSRVKRGRRDGDLQFGPSAADELQESQQEVDVEASFVGFVDDEGVVALEQFVRTALGEQDPVGHEFEERGGGGVLLKAHLAPHPFAEGDLQLPRKPPGHGHRGDAPGLGAADGAAPQFQRRLGQLGGLARSRGPADDDDLMMTPHFPDLRHAGGNGELIGVRDHRPGPRFESGIDNLVFIVIFHIL